jgi:hypothetical protein
LNKEAKPEADGDSQPLNFDTFVPDHDASLALPAPPYPSSQMPDHSGHHLQEPPGPIVSQDEAFNRATGAMYWAGYYSAVYHVSSSNSFTIMKNGRFNGLLFVSVKGTNAQWRMKQGNKNMKKTRTKSRLKKTRV